MQFSTRPVVSGLLLGAVFSALVPLAYASLKNDPYKWIDPLVFVHDRVVNDFVDEPDGDRLQVAAINGMLDSLNDPYTVYVPPSDEQAFAKVLQGSYVGIGAEIQIHNNFLTIVTPLEDSPALEAGVHSGDTVLEIDSKSTEGLSSDQCADLLMGEAGTPVRLKLRRTDGREQDVTVTRRQIVTRTIKGVTRTGDEWNFMLDPEHHIGYIRVTQFTDATIPNLVEALKSLGDIKGLVLDLRFNGGGTLNAAIEMSDLFLRSGDIVSVRGRNGESRTASAEEAGTLPDFPMVVLVNGASASASEIVAGALQDNHRAKVLGTRTYGKGSVQEVQTVGQNLGTLKMTTARYYLPSGRNIDRSGHKALWGVDPDLGYHVRVDNDNYRAMMERRRQYEVVNDGDAPDGRWNDPVWIENEIGDQELAAGLKAIQAFQSDGSWPMVGEEGGTTTALSESLDVAVAYRARLEAEMESVQRRIDELSGLPEAPKPEPVLPEGAKLKNGVVEVRDDAGNVIATFTIEDQALLEAAIEEARLRKIGP